MRNGIIAAGNWVVDYVKIIDTWPKCGMLANILAEQEGTGGAPYNVLLNLAKFETGIPLSAIGVIGKDPAGDRILSRLRDYSIDTAYLTQTPEKPTSYTYVMTTRNNGSRTFFHLRGANTLLGPEHFLNINTDAKICHLGYLLILDKLDDDDPIYGVQAARVLDHLLKMGIRTSVDVVSEAGERFCKIVTPCLPYIDYLILNEIEAGAITGFEIRKEHHGLDQTELMKAAEKLLEKGVRELVVIHFPEGAYAIQKNGEALFSPSFEIADSEIMGTVGAGDAFCAAMLYGIHEELPLNESLQLANANARFSLTSATATDGIVPLELLREYLKTAKPRKVSSE